MSVRRNDSGSSIERSTWVSAAKFTIASTPPAAVDRRADGVRVADAALHEAVARVVGDGREVLQVAGVGELVVDDDLPVGVLGEHAADEGGADEPGAAA